MARTPKDVTDAELAVLEVLWEAGPLSIRDVADRLYPGGGPSEYATVQKLCERLVGKRYVARDRRHRPQQFRASIDREGLIGRELKSVADKLCGGAYTPLLNHLLQGGSLTAAELESLKSLVARLGAEERNRKGRR